MIVHAGEYIGKPGLRIDIVEFGGLDQRVHGPDRDAAQRPLGGIVGHAQPPVIEEAGERWPPLEAVIDRLGGIALR